MTQLHKVEQPTFTGTASVDVDADTLLLELTGTADLVVREEVDGLVKQVHAEAQRLGVNAVAVDFRALEFMNSSCFKSFVAWINRVHELPADDQYRIRLITSPQMLWQRRSMHALQCFAKDLVDIEG